jgi:Peptidase family M1 domain
MNRGTLLLLPILCGTVASMPSRPVLFPRPLSNRLASYTISVTLDPAQKSLSGNETLVWRNGSAETVSELQLHLYLNAFRNAYSTFLREGGGRRSLQGNWGWTEIRSLTTAEGVDLTRRMEFIHPDDDNADDRTVVRVPLPRPLAPGKSLTLTCSFTAQLPAVVERTGYVGDFFMVGQWFPKIGVYETGRGWNCHQFHANTEFFADFGVYDVTITLPDRFIVGATGVRYAERKNADGTTTHSYYAEDVHDFAWTASPHFSEITDQWRHVSLRLLVQPEHRTQASRYLSSCIAAMEFFDRHVGPYPYPAFTLVDPPFNAIDAGGMEYPTLITLQTSWGIPASLRLPEQVTIHEFGHQYWQGMSASNEFEEAWLDEGINQYFEARIMSEVYGVKSSLVDWCGFSVGDLELIRSAYTHMGNPRIAPPATPAWQFPCGTYGTLTYDKTATALLTLERMIGTAAMDSAISGFFRRWRFHHPSGRDFVAAFDPSLAAFFDQTILGTAVCDFELSAIRNVPVAPPTGTPDSALYTASVVVSRRGDMILPVEVLVKFADGRERRELWDGRATHTEFSYRSRSPILLARVDPDTKILLDVNLTNNSRTVDPPSAPVWKYALKILFWFQNMISAAGLIG